MAETTFRGSFWGVASLIKLLVLQWVAILTLGQAWGEVARALGSGPCPADTRNLDWLSFLGLAIGLAALGWWLWRSFRPKVLQETFQGQVRAGGLVLSSKRLGQSRYDFASSHPAYLGVDLITLLLAWFLADLTGLSPTLHGCAFVGEGARADAYLAVALAFPLLRLVAWFGVGRRLGGGWRLGAFPVLWLWLLLLPIAGIGALAYWQIVLGPQSAAPLVSARPKDPSSDVVYRFQGEIEADGLVRCDCQGDPLWSCGASALLLRLEDGTRLLLTVSGLGSEDLVELNHQAPSPAQSFGQLVKPDPRLCGFKEKRPDLTALYRLP